MRIQCTFNLAPELHEQHAYAVENLRSWQVSEKARQDQKDIAQQRRSIFHRDIYLTGLYLYQISPELPKIVSEYYTGNGVSVKKLTQQLALFDELDVKVEAPILPTPVEAELSQTQWQKLEAMFAQQQATLTEQHNKQADDSSNAFIDQLTSALDSLQQQQALMLAQLTKHIENQASLTEQVQPANSNKPNEATDLAPYIKALDGNKADLISVIESNQKALVSAFNHLKKQVLTSNQSGQAASYDASLEQDNPLNAQLARASKVKAKGLW